MSEAAFFNLVERIAEELRAEFKQVIESRKNNTPYENDAFFKKELALNVAKTLERIVKQKGEIREKGIMPERVIHKVVSNFYGKLHEDKMISSEGKTILSGRTKFCMPSLKGPKEPHVL